IRDFHVTGVQTCALPISAGQAARPVATPGEVVAGEGLEGDRRYPLPAAVGVAVVRNARAGTDAGAGQHEQAPVSGDEVAQRRFRSGGRHGERGWQGSVHRQEDGWRRAEPGVADMLHEIGHMSAWRAAADSVVWRRRYIVLTPVELRSAAPKPAKGTAVTINSEQRDRIASGQGFIAALDQSGGSTPKALKLYGIDESAYANDAEMFALVHRMRERIVTSPAFDGRILGAILFERTLDDSFAGQEAARFLWEQKKVVPFLKIDKGLADEEGGVQLLKPIPGLEDLLARAKAK